MLFFASKEPELYFRELENENPSRKITCLSNFEERLLLSRDVSARRVKFSLRGNSDYPVFLEKLVLTFENQSGLSIIPELSSDLAFSIYRHGFQSWSFSGAQNPGSYDLPSWLGWKRRMDENAENARETPWRALPRWLQKGQRSYFYSDGFLGLESTSLPGAALLFGTAGPGHQFVRFEARLDSNKGILQKLKIIWDFNGQYFDRHSITAITPVFFHAALPGRGKRRGGRTLEELLRISAKQIGQAFHARTDQGPVAGWCSWYYYYTNIDQKKMIANLDRIRTGQIPLTLFQIDDGYQNALGDWEPNEKFPDGMQFLARASKKAGLTPGIWIAPFLAEKKSSLMKSSFVLNDEKGRPVRALYNPNWGGNAYALDVTHPDFQDWLLELIDKVVHRWGFEYLKLDFLYAGCLRGVHYDRRTTAYSRLHAALKIIRKAAGKKTRLVGCGCPLFPAVGLVDIMRIGMDVHHSWKGPLLGRLLRDRNFPQMKHALANTITRAFLHRSFWINDPDCLMIRSRETALSPAQIILMASVMALSGGLLLTSDELTGLTAENLDLLAKTIELGKACSSYTPQCLDLMQSDFPCSLWNPAGYLGLWNPTARPALLSLQLPVEPPGLCRDYWTGQRMPWRIEGNEIRLGLAPYEAMVACF